MIRCHAFTQLSHLMGNKNARLVASAASIVRSSARLDEVLPVLLEIGAIETLLDLLKSPTDACVEHAAGALRNCSSKGFKHVHCTRDRS